MVQGSRAVPGETHDHSQVTETFPRTTLILKPDFQNYITGLYVKGVSLNVVNSYLVILVISIFIQACKHDISLLKS